MRPTSHAITTTKLSDISAKEIERIVTGPWDVCWGGGIVPTSMTMLGGFPGAGKSTFLLQLGQAVTDICPGGIAYVGTEESAAEIKGRADRLEITNQNRFYMISALDEASEAIKELDLILELETISLIILDSLQGLTSGDFVASLKTLKALKSRCVRHKCPGIVISHINKSGDYAGLMTFQHAVDCLITLETGTADGNRILQTRKNRNGPAPAEFEFKMTGTGLRAA